MWSRRVRSSRFCLNSSSLWRYWTSRRKRCRSSTNLTSTSCRLFSFSQTLNAAWSFCQASGLHLQPPCFPSWFYGLILSPFKLLANTLMFFNLPRGLFLPIYFISLPPSHHHCLVKTILRLAFHLSHLSPSFVVFLTLFFRWPTKYAWSVCLLRRDWESEN